MRVRILLVVVALVLLIPLVRSRAENVDIEPIHSKSQRKNAVVIIRQIKATEMLLAWLKGIACGAEIMEYCSIKEEPVIAKISTADYLGVYSISRYYSPVEGQDRYFNEWKDKAKACSPSNLIYLGKEHRLKGSLSADMCMNCGGGECIHTADGTDLRLETPFRVAACPPELKLGTKLEIEGIGNVVCRDRGGTIKKKKIDVWAGFGKEGYENILNGPGGQLKVYLR